MGGFKRFACVLFSFILAWSMSPIVPASAMIANGSSAASADAATSGIIAADTQAAADEASANAPTDTMQGSGLNEGASTPVQQDEGATNIPAGTSSWQKLQDAIQVADDGATVVLEADCTASEDDVSLMIPAGKSVTLDLAGHVLDRGLSSSREDGHVVQVNGKLSIVDTSASAGKITGGNAQDGGGIIVNAGGRLDFEGGIIQGNAARNGGGIYVASDAVLNLSGGAIKGNSAGALGGGVRVSSGANAVSAQGVPVVQGNSAGASGADMYLPDGFTLEVSGPLSAGARLGVELETKTGVFTSGFARSNGNADPGAYFTASDGLNVAVSEGEAQLVSVGEALHAAEGEGDVHVGSEQTLQAAIDSATDGQAIVLDNDITTGNTLKVIRAGISFAIDLNGHTINRNLSSQDDDNNGHVFDVNKGTLTIKDNVGYGKITGGYDENGGGIVIGGEGTLNIESGAITGNKAKNGGGIFVYGALNMTGGTVSDNIGGDCGGIYNYGGTVNLKNVTVSGNSTNGAGGAGINNKGTATVTNCKVSGNKADRSGGGIYNGSEGNLTVENCTISKNSSKSDGGALHSYGMATLAGCTISENTSEAWGGAIRVCDSTVTINGGTITKNTASGLGGAICVSDDGTLNLNDVVSITDNTAYKGGGGIWVASNSSAVNVGSGVVVKNNIANNIYLASGKKINVSGALAAGTEIGVAMEDISGTFTTNYANTNSGAEPDQFFLPEPGFSIAKDDAGEAKVIASNWTLLQKKIDAANDGDTITLDTDYLGVDENVALSIPAGKTIEIDLNGFKIDRRRSSYTADGEVITVNGHLTVTDRLNSTAGTITGGDGDCGGIRVNGGGSFKLLRGNILSNKAKVGGGGIRVFENGTLEITGGSVSGNSSEAQGGGIYNSGTMTYAGAAVSKNSATKEGGGIYIEKGSVTIASGVPDGADAIFSNSTKTNGGGIYVADGALSIEDGSALVKISSNVAEVNGGGIYIGGGTVTMNAGEISGNTAANNKDFAEVNEGMGGGVYLATGATLNLYGGTITKNDAAFDGGGIFVVGGSAFNVQGFPYVTGNTATVGKNILLSANPDSTGAYGAITVTGALTVQGDGAAKLDVLTQDHSRPLTSGFAVSGDSEIKCFTTNDVDNSHLEERDSELYIKNSTADLWVSSWGELKSAIKKDNRDKVIGLSNDIVAGDDDESQKVDIDGTITIELNGYTINRNLEHPDGGDGHVFNVREDSTLNLRDSIGTGAIMGGYADIGGGIYIDTDATVNTSDVAITNNWTNDTTRSGGGGFLVKGTLNMTGGSVIRNASVAHGGGIYVGKDGKVTLTGVIVAHNACEDDGGGIYTIAEDGDSVSINTSVIRDNWCYRNGGGIHVYESSCLVRLVDSDIVGNGCREGHGDTLGGGICLEDGRVDMKGGSLSGNQSKSGGGIHNDNCALTLDGVTVSKNKAFDSDGGGIAIESKGTLGAVNCTFSENEAHVNGGGVYANKKTKRAELEGCTFTGNKAVSGGGLYAGGTTTVKGATMSKNEATQYGGGIYLHEDSTLSLDGSATAISISANRAAAKGGGIWVSDDADDINAKGDIDVLNNDANSDLFLEDGKKIKVIGDLAGSQTRVILGNGTGTFTSGFPGNNPNIDPGDYFLAQDGYAVIPDGNGEGQVVSSDWSLLQRKINETPDGGTLKLEGEFDRDWKAAPQNLALYISSGKTITLDLNGHTIDRARSEYGEGGEVFTVDGTLTLVDTSEGDAGKVIGGYGQGGGAVVNDGGTLILAGGNITGNKAKIGGGVLVNAGGELVVSGCVITANHATETGGGVYSYGTTHVTGGSITANEAVNSAGGIGFSPSSVFCVSDNPQITDNLAPVGKNVLIPGSDNEQSGVINVSGALSTSAKIDVVTQDANSALTRGLTANGGLTDAQALGVFSYNGASDKLEVRDQSGELFLIQAQADVTVSDWQALQNAIDAPENQGKVIALAKDITAGGGDDRLWLKGKNVIIDLNGYQLDRHLDESDSDGHVFELSDNSTLTIRDSAGTGRITGGYAEHGGAINIHEGSVCNIEGGAITGNRASDEGGAIYVYGTLNMTGGSIARNSAESAGGIYVHENGTAILANVTLTNNKASKWGGGAINNKGVATLESCVIRDNSAGNEGGGIYNGSKELTLRNCTISENSAPGGGGICCFGAVTMENTKISGNHAGDVGGGIDAHGTLNVTGGEFSGNSGGDAGGIYISGGTITLTNVSIHDNWGSGGGALNNKTGTATLTGCTIQANSSANEGGALFVGSGSSGTTLDTCTLDNNHAGGDGGAICAYGPAALTNCTLTSNKTDHAGGALLVHSGTSTVTNTTMEKNEAATLGGGAYVNDGSTLSLVGGTITNNTATEGGDGVWISGGSGTFNIQGAVTVSDNNGSSDVYVSSGKRITVTGPLWDENGVSATVGVYIPDGVGVVFTSGFADTNPNSDPAAFFKSDEGYAVYLEGSEASTKKRDIDINPFVDPGLQVNRYYNELTGNNWMSGIAGQRYLNEINIPGTHDSGTRSVEGNVSTGNLMDYAFFAGFVVLGPLILPQVVANYCAKFAKCQSRFIDEQLEDGIRSLDIRLDTYYCEPWYPPNKHDNGEDLYVLHGKEKMTGSYFAKDHNDDYLTFDTVLTWIKDFLEKHPSETVIMSVQIDSVDDVYDEGMARIVKHLRKLEGEVNPATGKSYLYLEDGVFGKRYSGYPQLKDCRGQIVLQCGDSDADILGGLVKGAGLTRVDGPEGDYHDNAEQKIFNLTNFYADHGNEDLPADVRQHLDYYYSVSTNGTDTRIPPRTTPLEIADDVLDAMFGENGLIIDKTGKFLGLINMDDENARVSKIVWSSNFFSALGYCTVTVKSGIDEADTKSYSVPYGTKIPIPECVYANPIAPGKYFHSWEGKLDNSISGHTWYSEPGETWIVTGDTTFTAQWGDQQTPVTVLWHDAQDADNLRPSELSVTAGGVAYSIEATKNWRLAIPGDVKPADLAVSWDKIDDGTYACDIKASEVGSKIIIELTHTPDVEPVRIQGTVNWVDDDDAEHKRPENVTLRLLANGSLVDSKVVRAEDGWAFDFGEYNPYRDGEKVTYTITEEDVDDYSHYVKGYEVTNVLRSSKNLTEISGLVMWVDGDDAQGKRPDGVTVNLLKDGEQIATQSVTEDASGSWPISFSVQNVDDLSNYSVTEDKVDGYKSTVLGFDNVGGILFVVNTIDGHEHTPQTITMPILPATCTQDGSRFVAEYCTECGEVLSRTTETIPALGHEWGNWHTVKEATLTEMGEESRTCSRCGEEQSRVIPKTGHVHALVHIDEVPATCTENGIKAHWKCAGGDDPCGLLFMDKAATEWVHEEGVVEHALGHDWGEPVYTWSSDNSSVTATRACKHDAAHVETETVLATRQVKEESTCTQAGVATWTSASFENEAFEVQVKDGELPALGHDWGEWEVVTPATETEDGLEQRICARCGEVETRVIPAAVEYRYVGTDGLSWTKGGSEALTFTFKRSLADETTFSHFTGIMVDGVALPGSSDSGEPNYTARSGSVVVDLQPAYLETLGEGHHEMNALFDDGSASATFAVTAGSPASSGDDGSSDGNAQQKAAGKAVTRTGDTQSGATLLAMALMAALAIATLLIARRMRKE